jgi:hypothetical protein
MNFDALLGDELMLARVAVRHHVVHAAHAVSMCVVFNVWLWWRVLQARVLLHFRLWLQAAERHRMYMCFVAVSVSVSARCVWLCFLCVLHDCAVLTFLFSRMVVIKRTSTITNLRLSCNGCYPHRFESRVWLS